MFYHWWDFDEIWHGDIQFTLAHSWLVHPGPQGGLSERVDLYWVGISKLRHSSGIPEGVGSNPSLGMAQYMMISSIRDFNTK